ncbi:MAG TPA: 50S ribosomal protein L34 [Candidatus Dojkabacteria bacterium]|nr:50S ribosomal protein L34 [Candidatus Dojkabacteria bacterium]
MKRTYQPNNMRRIKKLGFRARNSSVGGRRVLKTKRAKGRKALSVSEEYKLMRKKHKKNIK